MSKDELNLFGKPLSETEQLELSDLLDKFLQAYENNFDSLTGDVDDDADFLMYEFKGLYDMVRILSDRNI